MRTKWITFSTIEMMLKKEKFCGLEINLINDSYDDGVKIDRNGKDELTFIFRNGEIQTLPLNEGLEKIKKLKELLKEKNIEDCYINNLYIAIYLKDNKF